MSNWLFIVASTSLLISVVCAGIVAVEVAKSPQNMWMMDIVWPITALWSGPIGVWAYRRWGRAGSKRATREAKEHGREPPDRTQPFFVFAAKAATHCGSGCTLGDIVAELLIVFVPITVFGKHIFGAWIYDFLLAYGIGVFFQYFTIKPMRGLSFVQGLVAAVKADSASLIAWQIGIVRLDGHRYVRDLSTRAAQEQPRVLVHDADRDGMRLRDGVSGQLVVAAPGREREDVRTATCC